MSLTAEPILLEFSRDEALVLFELLSRFSNSGSLALEDQAEEVALWGLTGMFEKVLVEPFREDYAELLNAARDRLRHNQADAT